jgi:hypothetical protein
LGAAAVQDGPGRAVQQRARPGAAELAVVSIALIGVGREIAWQQGLAM